MQVTAQNRKIIPLRWKHLILSLDPKGIVVLYLFTNILFFLRGVRLLTTWTNWLTVNLRACRFSTHSRFPPHRFLTPPKSFTFVVQHGDSSYRAWKMSSCKQINHPLAFFHFINWLNRVQGKEDVFAKFAAMVIFETADNLISQI